MQLSSLPSIEELTSIYQRLQIIKPDETLADLLHILPTPERGAEEKAMTAAERCFRSLATAVSSKCTTLDQITKSLVRAELANEQIALVPEIVRRSYPTFEYEQKLLGILATLWAEASPSKRIKIERKLDYLGAYLEDPHATIIALAGAGENTGYFMKAGTMLIGGNVDSVDKLHGGEIGVDGTLKRVELIQNNNPQNREPIIVATNILYVGSFIGGVLYYLDQKPAQAGVFQYGKLRDGNTENIPLESNLNKFLDRLRKAHKHVA